MLLNGQGIYHLMGGALWYGWGIYGLNGWGSYDKVSCCFVWKYAQKIAGLQGSTLSDHRMTTGFGPFELPTCGLLQRGRDHSPPKACFNWGAQLFGWFSKYYEYTVAKQNYEYTVAKQNGGGAEWVELFITLTKGWANQRTDFSCLSSRPGVRGLFSASSIEGSSLDTCWILGACSATTLSR